MVDFKAPNLQGANTAYNNIVSKLNDTKNSALSNLQADASAAASELSSQLADVNTELRSLVPEPSSIPNVNLQAQLQSLSGLTNPLQSANLLADITSSFGDALTTSGFDLDSLVSSAAGVFGTGTSLSGLIPNFELSAAGDVIQKATASLLPSIGPVTEEAAAFVSNTNFTAAKTAATSAVLSTSDALPTADSGAYKIATKFKTITQSSGGSSISQKVTTPADAYEDGVRKTISSEGLTNSVGTITETLKREDGDVKTSQGVKYVVYILKNKFIKIEKVIGIWITDTIFEGENIKLRYKIIPATLPNPSKLDSYTIRRTADADLSIPKIGIFEFYGGERQYDIVKITYKYADTYDPTYAKPEP